MDKKLDFVSKFLPSKQELLYLKNEFLHFASFIKIYSLDKVFLFSNTFEKHKNSVVKGILIRRGKRNRFFLHTAAMALLTIGVIISPFISDSTLFTKSVAQGQGFGGPESLSPDDVFQTQTSEKPRDTIISYTVQNGDTISTIAKKFGVSEETIKWSNNLKSDNIVIGDTLDIMPVTGISHKVERGDTVYSIAKKYSANSQAIVDYPFNDFANPQTFSLVEGQILIVPEGVKPEEAPKFVRRTFIVKGPTAITGEGFTWPLNGSFNQSFAWYHPGIDIGANVGAPIVSAHTGTVVEAYASGWNWGYGIHVVIRGDNGYTTLYAHMSGVNVSPGDRVSAGSSLIGWVGLTGRTTGPHLHFEIRGGGGNVNPLGFLQ